MLPLTSWSCTMGAPVSATPSVAPLGCEFSVHLLAAPAASVKLLEVTAASEVGVKLSV